jgi:hypothetical protein
MKTSIILSIIVGVLQMSAASAEDCQVNIKVGNLPARVIGIKANLTGPTSGSGGQGAQCAAYANSIALSAINSLNCEKLPLKPGAYLVNTNYHFKNNIMGGQVNQSHTGELLCGTRTVITSQVVKVGASAKAIPAVPNAQ